LRIRPSFGWQAGGGEEGPPKRVDRLSDRRRGQYSVCILPESARVIGRGQTPQNRHEMPSMPFAGASASTV